jgi:hypothetical protein
MEGTHPPSSAWRGDPYSWHNLRLGGLEIFGIKWSSLKRAFLGRGETPCAPEYSHWPSYPPH